VRDDVDLYDLNQWLSFLELRHTNVIQLGLERVTHVADTLNILTFDCPIILVAGTNGKGSTVAMLEAIYTRCGYQVGAYTSPHLLQFNERIRVNGQMVDDDSLCRAFLAIEQARGDVDLTYFEVATLAALLLFKRDLDIIILEVGMGGRLDATNIVSPSLSIITGIDWDHQAYLGDTLEAIAFEKAGIIRYNIPVIFADTTRFKAIIDKASAEDASLWALGDGYHFDCLDDNRFIMTYGDGRQVTYPKPHLNLKAATAALMAVSYLQAQLPVDEATIDAALQSVTHPGRLQWLNTKIPTLLDVAHNPQSVSNLANYLKNVPCKGKIYAIFGVLADKDIKPMLESISDVIDVWLLVDLPKPRGMKASALRNYFEGLDACIEGEYATALDAYESLQTMADARDIIVIFGSFLTVANYLMGKSDEVVYR